MVQRIAFFSYFCFGRHNPVSAGVMCVLRRKDHSVFFIYIYKKERCCRYGSFCCPTPAGACFERGLERDFDTLFLYTRYAFCCTCTRFVLFAVVLLRLFFFGGLRWHGVYSLRYTSKLETIYILRQVFFLGYMVHKLLMCSLGRLEEDDRDHYGE